MPKNPTEVSLKSELPVTQARAFGFLTDRDALRGWFAEAVEIEPRLGGRFTFDGRGAYLPTATVLREFEPDQAIGWDWPVHGVVVAVRITLAPSATPGTCRVHIHCAMDNVPDVPRGFELVDDLWRFHLASLLDYARGETPVHLPDFSDPSQEVRQDIHIAAPRDAVFRALLDPVLLSKWTGAEASVDPKVGGHYSWGWEIGPTRIIALRENELLTTDFPDWRGDTTNASQTITWTLADDGDGTRLTLIHRGFSRPSDISDFPFGWDYFLRAISAAVVAA